MYIKAFIKVPLVFLENIFFSIFPNSRSIIERYIYNPYQFNEKHIEYSKNQFEEFIKKIGGAERIRGKNILELGPGGSLGFGILALINGASKYYAVDDGTHAFIKKKQLDGYRKMLENDEFLFNQFFIKKGSEYNYNHSKIQFISIDQETRYSLSKDSVDFIYSCAVLEHVFDLDFCFSEMIQVLKNGGIMNHQIDLRDHIFSQNSLCFLKIKEFWFKKFFGSTGGYVNRKRLSYYKELFQKNNLEVINLEKNIIFEGIIPKNLANTYSEEDLKTLSFNITLRKK